MLQEHIERIRQAYNIASGQGSYVVLPVDIIKTDWDDDTTAVLQEFHIAPEGDDVVGQISHSKLQTFEVMCALVKMSNCIYQGEENPVIDNLIEQVMKDGK